MKIKSNKPSFYRTFANNCLELLTKDGFSLPLSMRIDITDLLVKKDKTSMNALFIKAMAMAIKENPDLAAINTLYQRTLFGPRVYSSENINIALALDRMWQGERVAAGFIVKNAEQKSLADIDQEIKQSRELEVQDLELYKYIKLAKIIPDVLQRIILKVSNLFPSSNIMEYGSITLSNVGNGAILNGSAKSAKTMMFILGGTEKVLKFDKDKNIVERTVLSATGVINHYVVDGMISNKFLTEVKRNIEECRVFNE